MESPRSMLVCRVRCTFALLVLLATAPGARAAGAATAAACDLLLAGGRVVDGTGAPWTVADVCVRGDRVVAVGRLGDAPARRRIDAAGLVVAPGFIDMLGQSEYNVLVDPRAASKVTQGITTEITGEGSSIAPLDARLIAEGDPTWKKYGVTPGWTTLAGYWKAFERARPTINLGTFVGEGGVRNLVVGEQERAATPEEMARMEAAVAQAMEEGAFGLSTSLQYMPDRYASTEEIVALAKVAARYGGTYITHQRSESYQIDQSLDEVFRVAREARIPAQIFHLKTSCRGNWGRMPAVLERIEQARAEGLDVAANQYPYVAAANGLDANLPLWAREGGHDKEVERLRDPATRARIKAEILGDERGWENEYLCAGGAPGILVVGTMTPQTKPFEGKRLSDIAQAQGKDPVDALMDILIADHGDTGNIVFVMDEGDVRAALRSRLVSLGTDAGAVAEDGPFAADSSHPRAWGSTARILGRYVRDEKLLPLEEAIRKLTSLPASRMGLVDRGVLRPGAYADLVVFDPATVADRSTFEDPRHYSAGIPYVAVNGQLVVDGGKLTDARPGRPLYGPGYRAPH